MEQHLKVQGVKSHQKALILSMLVILPDGMKIPLKALVDTGCESNLVRKGLIPQKYFAKATKGVRFVAANGSILGGGDHQVSLELISCVKNVDDETRRFLKFPTTFYEADISVDALLSFSWLQDFDLDLRANAYGLQSNTDPAYFTPGVTELMYAQTCQGTQVKVQEVRVVYPSQVDLDLGDVLDIFPHVSPGGGASHQPSDYPVDAPVTKCIPIEVDFS